MDVLRRMTGDLVKHDRAEAGVEYELSPMFGRLGQSLPVPDRSRG